MRTKDEFVLLQRTYDLVADLIPRLHRFPRTFKFTLGDRLEGSCLDGLQLLVEARWRRDRRDLLDRANGRLDRLRYLLRLASDFGLLKVTVLGAATGEIDEIGRMIGAWRRKTARS